MIYFILIFLLLGVLSNFQLRKKLYINILNLFISFILAFSYNTGGDWYTYQKFYNIVVPNVKLTEILYSDYIFEKGYVFINYIFYNLGFSYRIFSGIIIFICVYYLLTNLKKKCDNYCLALMYFLSYYLVGAASEPTIRQLIAITLIVFSFKYLEKKKYYFFIVILIAMQFHNSALLFIIVYFFQKIKIKNFFYVISVFLIIIIINNYIADIIDKVPYFSKYGLYLTSVRYGINNKNFYIKLIKYLSYGVVSYIIYNISLQFSYKKNYIVNGAFLYIIFLLLSNNIVIFYRVSMYFIFLFTIMISYIPEKLSFYIKKINKKLKKYIILNTIIIISCFHMYRFFTSSELKKYKYSNYKNYLFEKIKGKSKEEISFEEKKYINGVLDLLYQENKKIKKGEN